MDNPFRKGKKNLQAALEFGRQNPRQTDSADSVALALPEKKSMLQREMSVHGFSPDAYLSAEAISKAEKEIEDSNVPNGELLPLEGDAAVIAVGMQPAFAAHLREANIVDVDSYRGPEIPNQQYNILAAPKPGWVKHKSSNNFFMMGKIAVDVEFSRRDKYGDTADKVYAYYDGKKGKQAFDELKKKNSGGEVQASMNLSRLIYGLSTGDVIHQGTVVGKKDRVYQKFSANDGTSVLICLDDFKRNANTGKSLNPESVNLSERRGSSVAVRRGSVAPGTSYSSDMSSPAIEESIIDVLSRMAFNASSLHSEHDTGSDLFAPIYKVDQSPLNALGVIQPNGQVLAITGDWDKLLVGFDKRTLDIIKTHDMFHDEMLLPINTKDENNSAANTIALHKMSDDLISIMKQQGMLTGKLEKVDGLLDLLPMTINEKGKPVVDQTLINVAGAITPMEFVRSQITNFLMRVGDEKEHRIQNMSNPLQHGPENNNPLKPSSLEGNMITFYKGESITTRSEEQLIKLYMGELFVNGKRKFEGDASPVKNTAINIHPLWDMRKWGRVVRAQVRNGQEVDLKVLENCRWHYSNARSGEAKAQELEGVIKERLGSDEAYNQFIAIAQTQRYENHQKNMNELESDLEKQEEKHQALMSQRRDSTDKSQIHKLDEKIKDLEIIMGKTQEDIGSERENLESIFDAADDIGNEQVIGLHQDMLAQHGEGSDVAGDLYSERDNDFSDEVSEQPPAPNSRSTISITPPKGEPQGARPGRTFREAPTQATSSLPEARGAIKAAFVPTPPSRAGFRGNKVTPSAKTPVSLPPLRPGVFGLTTASAALTPRPPTSHSSKTPRSK